MFRHFCRECAEQVTADFCPDHPGAIVDSIFDRDAVDNGQIRALHAEAERCIDAIARSARATDDDRIRAILAKCSVEFTPDGLHPDYDPNLAELCRSALRGNREHAKWVLEATA